MSRIARQKSESGIYHVMLRGINRQLIFEERQDNEKFLEILKKCQELSRFKIYSYCLMGNHLHLLIKVEHEDLEQIFKRIGARYVYWFNFKYKRCGHLFQDRFRSEPVENDAYFLTVLRYIHQNPIKAGYCKNPADYPWSSFREYLSSPMMIDISFALSMMNLQQFIDFHQVQNSDHCLELPDLIHRLSDQEATKIIKDTCFIQNATDFQRLNQEKRNSFLKALKARGLSIRQLARLTGVSKGIIENAWLDR